MSAQRKNPKFAPFTRERYISPGRQNPIALSGKNILFRYSRPKFKSIQELESQLEKIDTYTRHRQAKKPTFNPYFVYSLRGTYSNQPTSEAFNE